MTHLAIGVGTPPPTYIRTGQKERVCRTNTHLATCPVRITKPPFVIQLPILLFVFCLTNTHLATCPVLFWYDHSETDRNSIKLIYFLITEKRDYRYLQRGFPTYRSLKIG